MPIAINADVTHSKRSPGIDKANKLTYYLSTKTQEGREEGKKKQSASSCHNEYGTYSCRVHCWCDDCTLFSCICHKVPLCLQGYCVGFDKMGWGEWGGRPEVMTLSCGSGNLHDKRNRCFAACYKCLFRPWSNAGRKTDVSFHAMFSNTYTHTHIYTQSFSLHI